MFRIRIHAERSDLRVSDEMGFIGEMSSMRTTLNQVKDRLEENYDEKKYRQVLRQLDRVDFLRGLLEKKYKASHVTKAWMKMYEILSNFELIPRDGTVTTLHLCEAPGCFIQAFDYYIKHWRRTVYYNWKAQTLTRDGALPDQYGLIKGNADRWIKSYDDGDISSVRNILLYQKLVEADIVTSDVGIPIETMKYRGESGYNHQEELLLKLHLAQVTAGLHTLKSGGSLIVKTFTFFEKASIGLLYLLTQCFDQVNLTKPVASRPSNSEVYLVCTGYRKVSDETLKYLRDLMNSDVQPESCLFEVPSEFIQQCVNLQRILVESQTQALEYIIKAYQSFLRDKDSIKTELTTNRKYQSEWLKKCRFT